MAKYNLLLVDDEENILNSLIRVLRCSDYDIKTASSGEEALKILEKEDIALIISDYRMDGMNGVEFLAPLGGVSLVYSLYHLHKVRR